MVKQRNIFFTVACKDKIMSIRKYVLKIRNQYCEQFHVNILTLHDFEGHMQCVVIFLQSFFISSLREEVLHQRYSTQLGLIPILFILYGLQKLIPNNWMGCID